MTVAISLKHELFHSKSSLLIRFLYLFLLLSGESTFLISIQRAGILTPHRSWHIDNVHTIIESLIKKRNTSIMKESINKRTIEDSLEKRMEFVIGHKLIMCSSNSTSIDSHWLHKGYYIKSVISQPFIHAALNPSV